VHLATLTLEQFRTYQSAQLQLTEPLTVCVGRNAAGKSNLLEAIRLLSTTHPVHATRDAHLIKHGTGFARVTGHFTSAERDHELLCVLDTATGRTKKLWRLQGAPKTSRAVVGLLTTLLFKPEDVDVLQKSASARRAILDQLLVIRDPELFTALQRMRTTLQQRQSLLEQVRAGEASDADLYDEQLVVDGARISAARARLTQWLAERFSEYVKTIAGRPDAHAALTLYSPMIEGVSTTPTTESEWVAAYRSSISNMRDREIASARNLVGPHREDVHITYNDQVLREFGSRGEWRSAVIGLLLASSDYIESRTKERPILLLDDVFSELDEHRRARLLPYLDRQQTIITTADQNELPESIRAKAAHYTISNGTITLATTHALAA